jgi:hypothetical protein
MSKCILSIIFSLLHKLLKLMHLDTGGNEIVFSTIFSPKKVNTKTICKTSIILSQLMVFRMEGKSKSFMYSVSEYSNK